MRGKLSFGQQRFNQLIILHVHKDITDDVDTVNNFVTRNEHRSKVHAFGKFAKNTWYECCGGCDQHMYIRHMSNLLLIFSHDNVNCTLFTIVNNRRESI